jgi:hypothetical protein
MANSPASAAAAIALDPETTDAGAMERLFLLEATTPGMPGYIAAENLRAMRLMRQTIGNRLKSPAEYGARGATSETDIVDLGGQFAGFGGYPALDADMTYNLKLFLRIANDPRDRRRPAHVQYVQDAITAAKEAIVPPVADFADATAWRTSGASSPGPRFRLLTTLSGNDFYATNPRRL